MNDTTSGSDFNAGALELLRRFKRDSQFAEGSAAACLDRAKAAESTLKAYEYLQRDVGQADHQRTAELPRPRAGAGRLGRRTPAPARRHDLREDGVDRVRLA